ncbi:MAG: hypothetical protein V4739_01960 [Pseudomonadota bacterium]
MANPWLKKNPFMSLWLSGANSVASSARGQATAQAKRHTHAAVQQATQEVMLFWTQALGASASRAAKRKRR